MSIAGQMKDKDKVYVKSEELDKAMLCEQLHPRDTHPLAGIDEIYNALRDYEDELVSQDQDISKQLLQQRLEELNLNLTAEQIQETIICFTGTCRKPEKMSFNS